MGRASASYNLYPRNGNFYVRFKDGQGKFSSGINTHQANKNDALLVVADWVKNGIPSAKSKNTRHVDEVLEVKTILDSIKKAPLSEEEALKIVEILKERNLVKINATKTNSAERDFIRWLKDFWDYDKSAFVKDKLLHHQRIGKRHCYDMANRIRIHWEPYFSGRTLESITKSDLNEFSLKIGEKNLAAATINKIILAGTIALHWALKNDIITTSPYASLTRFSGPSRVRGILELFEAKKVLSMPWEDERCQVANLVSSTTGMRAGEIAALKVSDIDATLIKINHSWSERDGLKTPKNGCTREVPLLPKVKDAILALAKKNPHGPDGFIFYSTMPSRPMDSKLFAISLRKQYIKMKLKEWEGTEDIVNPKELALQEWKNRNLCFHSWRHFYTSQMDFHTDKKKVMKATGHHDEYAEPTGQDHYRN